MCAIATKLWTYCKHSRVSGHDSCNKTVLSLPCLCSNLFALFSVVGGTWVPATTFCLQNFSPNLLVLVRTVFFLRSWTAQSYFPVFTLLRALYFVRYYYFFYSKFSENIHLRSQNVICFCSVELPLSAKVELSSYPWALKFQLLHFGCHSLHFFLKAMRNPLTHAALNVFALADHSLRGEAFCGSMTKCLLPDASSFCCVSCSLCFSFFFYFWSCDCGSSHRTFTQS